MNQISSHQLQLIERASRQICGKNYNAYLELRRLLREQPAGYRLKFETLFKSYYGMNRAHLGEPFLQTFFEHLFALKTPIKNRDYATILYDLAKHKRKKGDAAIQFSFVTKLIAIRDEEQPIVDRHVANFFGLCAPRIGSVEFRIAGFVANLVFLKSIYHGWCADSKTKNLLAEVRSEHSPLKPVSDTRLLDLLVWLVGRQKLWKEGDPNK